MWIWQPPLLHVLLLNHSRVIIIDKCWLFFHWGLGWYDIMLLIQYNAFVQIVWLIGSYFWILKVLLIFTAILIDVDSEYPFHVVFPTLGESMHDGFLDVGVLLVYVLATWTHPIPVSCNVSTIFYLILLIFEWRFLRGAKGWSKYGFWTFIILIELRSEATFIH